MRLARFSPVLCFLSLACQDPRTVVSTVDNRPRILIHGAPKDSLLYVDAQLIGQAMAYNGEPNVLILDAGTHLVEVRLGEKTLYTQRIFLGGGETKPIQIN